MSVTKAEEQSLRKKNIVSCAEPFSTAAQTKAEIRGANKGLALTAVGSFSCAGDHFVGAFLYRPICKSKTAPADGCSKKCRNKEIKSEILESKIFAMIREWMLDPTKLREYMDFFRGKTQVAQLRMER